MASLFDTLQAQAFRAGITARTNASKKWFEANVKKLGQVNRTSLLKDDALEPTSRNIAGNMYMYFYDPKYKDTLPYYDRFPLTIMVEPAKGGFYGLNLHYLKPTIRAAFLDELMKTAPTKITDKSRIRARYKLLAGSRKYKEFKPCFKHYLTEHIKSKLVRVPMSEWEVAIFLPTEQFKKKGKAAIWADSLKISRS
tara:strand:+ start:2836 stop:3423 length:588 start_codon:yes stop_codon:yes gene_type:complete